MTEDKIEAFRALSQDLIALVEKHAVVISTMAAGVFVAAVATIHENVLAPKFRYDVGLGFDEGKTK